MGKPDVTVVVGVPPRLLEVSVLVGVLEGVVGIPVFIVVVVERVIDSVAVGVLVPTRWRPPET
jgi:hypothetical protein